MNEMVVLDCFRIVGYFWCDDLDLFSPCELWEEDACRVLLAYVLLFCIEKIRKHFREE